ncbi:type II secretion system protein [Bacillus marinisedimentorum]|uniref:type II secretion system protein n=1 Tax=Bacillus marinisedimentorum TaxID=1821260 RepID=UPI000871B690|nr:type II secretion system protein [Bacillus marinisedimentorum]
MLKKLRKNEKGFTLVELLAVIVILGIISAIAVPSVGKIIDKTENDATVADAIQIINAAKLAHASDPTVNEWDFNKLEDYLDKAKDDTFTVKYSGGVFSISDHEAVSLIKTQSNSDATETELIEAEPVK